MDPISGYFEPLSATPEKDTFECIYRSGGWCEIWRGMRNGEYRVYKCLKKQFHDNALYQELLRKEFEICRNLSHPGIRRCYALTELEGIGYCIEMEYVEGETLADLLDRGPLSPDLARIITDELLDAVAYLHRNNIRHNDLKPSNILLSRDGGHVKLIDFGLADTDSWAILKAKGGTPNFAPPEVQAAHGGAGSQAGDIYALGKILDLLGAAPRRVVRRCCRTNPRERWSYVEQIQEAMDRKRRFPWAIIIAAAAILLPLFWFHGPVTTFISSLIPVKNAPWTGLCIEAIEDGEISFHNVAFTRIQYSYDSQHWTTADTLLTLKVRRRDCVYFRGKNKSYARRNMEKSRYSHFHFSAPCYVYGNIMSLIDSTAFETEVSLIDSHNFARMFEGEQHLRSHPDKKLLLPAKNLTIGCYRWMFKGCTGITEAPQLPATVLKGYCYQGMFMDCSALQKAPELPALRVPRYAFALMFDGCHGLTEAPALPALQVGERSYFIMFRNCRSLTQAPALPATRLDKDCYMNMFESCRSITEAPDLPATELAPGCYAFLFSRTGIRKAPALPAKVLEEGCYKYMFSYCEDLMEAPVLPAEKLEPICYLGMFQYCSKLDRVTMLATDISASECLSHWLLDVAPEGTLTCRKGLDLPRWTTNGLPHGWTLEER